MTDASVGDGPGGGRAPGTDAEGADGEASYGGLFGAFPYAFRRSGSRLFRLYAVVAALLAPALSFFFLAALFAVAASTAGAGGGTFTFARALFVLVGLLVVFPVLAPVLLVARRHRRAGSDPRYDAALAAAGFLFVASLYLGAVASVPECFVLDGERVCRDPPSGPFAPLVALLYAVPSPAAALVPAAGAALVHGVHRALR